MKILLTFYPEGTIVTSGFSKWCSAGGWRAGYALFPRELNVLYKAVASAGSHTFTCCPAPVQFALSDGMDHEDELDSYILHTTKILKAVGYSVHEQLTESGVLCLKPEGGYYIMPDFLLCKKPLESKGIFDGQQMCDNMLKEAKVALMPGGPYYLRPKDELTTRYCYVNFDGELALKRSISLGIDHEIGEHFLHENCLPTLEGTQAVVDWVNSNK